MHAKVATVTHPLAQVMMWQELARRAPDLMAKSIIVLDCLADESEALVEKVTGQSQCRRNRGRAAYSQRHWPTTGWHWPAAGWH